MKMLFSLLLLLWPVSCFAESTIACHCFQNRNFNQQQPAAADAYFLASAQNGFMALVYGLDKKSLVKAKMAGADADELWILHEFSALSGRNTADIRGYYQRSGSWRSVASQLQLDPEVLGVIPLAALGGSSSQLAVAISDRRLVQYLGVDPETTIRARAAGMGTQELILAALIGAETGQIFRQIKSSQQSWGQRLFAAGIVDGYTLGMRLKAFF